MKSYALQQLGGEQIKSEFPVAYAVLSKVQRLDSRALAVTDGRDSSSSIYAEIESIFLSPHSLNILMRTAIAGKPKILFVVAEIFELESGKRVDAIHRYYEDSAYNEIRIQSNNSHTMAAAGEGVRIKSTFSWSIDGITTKEITREYTLPKGDNRGAEMFTELSISAPRAKDGKLTQVLYDREEQVSEHTDYHYTNIVDRDKKVAHVKLPYSGKIRVDDKLHIRSVMKNPGEEPTLSLILENGKSIQYQNAKGIIGQYVISPNEKELNWTFDEDWCADLDFSNFSIQTVVNLSAKFTLSIVHEDYPGYALHPVITVDSVLNPQTNVSTVAEIERIQIKWGCVAADTLIKMADGSCLRANEIQIGEVVATDHGHSVVRNIYKGTEKTIVHLETMDGHILRGTHEHPVKTGRGYVRMKEINGADLICTENGNSQVKYIYEIGYGDAVYSFDLSESSAMLCGGIWAGDFAMQNGPACNQSADGPKERSALQKEMYELVSKADMNT